MEGRNQSKLKSLDNSLVVTQSRRLCTDINHLRAMERDSFKKFRVQIERLSDPLREFGVQMAKMKRANDLLKGLRVRSVDPLKALRVQTEEMKRMSDSLKGLCVQSVDPLKALRVQMVQIDKSVVNFDRILDQIVVPTATFISTPGVDVFIEPEHPEIVEQPGIIPCPDDPARSSGKKVFIVCGTDEEAKQTVARSVEKLDLEVIIIEEQPSGALTEIEKLEKYTAKVDFIVVLLTPDDLGKPKDKLGEPNFRASQNVILRLGVLIGKYDRDRICFLCKGELELPSDINGINPVRMDTNGGWILNLIREMESVGLPVDMHKAI